MEKLVYKRQKFLASLNALNRAINIFLRTDIPDDVKECVLAATVKHYEMCYDTSWKFLQYYLAIRYNLKVDSPKKVFRECYDLELITKEITHKLLDICESRNATTHNYDEEAAQETCKRIQDYYNTFKALTTIPLEF